MPVEMTPIHTSHRVSTAAASGSSKLVFLRFAWHLPLQLMDFSRFLVLPVSPLLKGPVKLDSPGAWTVIYTATAIPAFFRVQDNGRLAFIRMRYIHIYLACIYTDVAPGADVRIEQNGIIRCIDVWNSEYFFLCHFFLQLSIHKTGTQSLKVTHFPLYTPL
jgi:hypothetical protein